MSRQEELASAIFNEGLKYAATGVSTIALRSGIDKAVQAAVASIASQSRNIKSKADKAAVATISANNDPETVSSWPRPSTRLAMRA